MQQNVLACTSGRAERLWILPCQSFHLSQCCESNDKGSRNRHGKDSDKIRNPHPLEIDFQSWSNFHTFPYTIDPPHTPPQENVQKQRGDV